MPKELAIASAGPFNKTGIFLHHTIELNLLPNRSSAQRKKLLNPFQWIQHTLDNCTSWFSLIPAGVVPRTLEPSLSNSIL